MALACRLCHAAAELEHGTRASYAVVLTHGSTENLMRRVEEIERNGVAIPSCCVLCEVCGRHSLISYSSRVFVYSKCDMDQQRLEGFCGHYQRLCLLHDRFEASGPSQAGDKTYADALAPV